MPSPLALRRCYHSSCSSRSLRHPIRCPYCFQNFCRRHAPADQHDCNDAPSPPVPCPACGAAILVGKGGDVDEAVLKHVERECKRINRDGGVGEKGKRGIADEVKDDKSTRTRKKRKREDSSRGDEEVLKGLQANSVSAVVGAATRGARKKRRRIMEKEKAVSDVPKPMHRTTHNNFAVHESVKDSKGPAVKGGAEEEDDEDDELEWEDGQQTVSSRKKDADVIVELPGTEKGGIKKSPVQNKYEQRLRAHLLAIAKTRSLEAHRFHLNLLVAMLLRMEAAANDPELQAVCLSLIPIDIFPSAASSKAQCVRRFALWFPQFVTPTPEVVRKRPCSISERCLLAVSKRSGTILDLIVVAAAMLRSAGMMCRIVTPLQPIPFRPRLTELHSLLEKSREIAHVDESFFSSTIPTQSIYRLPPFYAWLEVCIDSRWTHVDPFYGVVDEPWPANISRRIRSSTLDLMTKSIKTEAPSPNDVKDTAQEPVKTPAPPGAVTKKPKDIKEPGLVAHVVASFNGRLADVSRRYSVYWKGVKSSRAPRDVFISLLSLTCASATFNEEDEEIKQELEQATVNERAEFESLSADEGVPTTQAALKNHPRYVLEKHLLKYEFIHPREPVLGKVANSLIFSRANLKLLHTRDRWYREMRVVPEGATPLKWVNSKSRGQQVKVPLFGEWQTTALVVPPAKNGVVPKTARNQVELWTKEHLPAGTVHVSERFAAKAAGELGIDYAPAMVGFEVRVGRPVPVIDGIVVCEEFKEQIEKICAEMMRRETQIAAQKEREEARKSWRQLFRALRAKERVKKRYGGLMGADGTYQDMMKASKGNIRSLVEQDKDDDASGKSLEGKLIIGTTQSHEHMFKREIQLDNDAWEKQCQICGMSVTFQKL